jgi:protein tyrosine phosphatase (PTP) superfamily phosphohydrolase (DUF442 family)
MQLHLQEALGELMADDPAREEIAHRIAAEIRIAIAEKPDKEVTMRDHFNQEEEERLKQIEIRRNFIPAKLEY